MAPPGKLTLTDAVPLRPQLLKDVREAAMDENYNGEICQNCEP